TTPRLLTVSSMLPPHFPRRRLQRLMNFGALSRGFDTCCLRFKNDVAKSLQDSLPAGWLAFAGRASTLWIAAKGFRSSILLFWTWPGAREVSFEPPCSFTSFDHLVGAQQQCRGKVDTERFRGREIDGGIELDRIL